MLTKCLFLSGGLATYVFGVVDNQVMIVAIGAIVAICSTLSLLFQAVMSYRLKKMELAQTESHEVVKKLETQTNGMRAALKQAAKDKGHQEGVVEGKAIEKAKEKT